MKTAKMIVTMVINEVRAAHEMYEALLAREYDFNQIMADICMSMNNDIISTIYAIKSTDVEFDMLKYHQRFDAMVYKVHSTLMIASYMDRADVEEIINNIEIVFVKNIEGLIEEYMKPE